MKRLTAKHRLQGLSTAEITGAFEEAVAKISRRYEFQGRKLKPGPLINAIILDFLRKPEEEQIRSSGLMLLRLEEHLAETLDDHREITERQAQLAVKAHDLGKELQPFSRLVARRALMADSEEETKPETVDVSRTSRPKDKGGVGQGFDPVSGEPVKSRRAGRKGKAS